MGLELGFKSPIVFSAHADNVLVLVKNGWDLQAVVGAHKIAKWLYLQM